jgi:CheY-like chemotaxis protein
MKNIFLADDDADDVMFFEDALNGLSLATELTVTVDGAALMNKLDEVVPPPPDAIFLDLNMPRKSGFECLTEIRKDPKLKNIPVVIFSTSDHPNSIETTYSLGANYYICKPRSFELLKEAVKTILFLDDSQLTKQPSKENYFLKFG